MKYFSTPLLLASVVLSASTFGFTFDESLYDKKDTSLYSFSADESRIYIPKEKPLVNLLTIEGKEYHEMLLGDHKDNGGDALKVDERFILRDFLTNNYFKEIKGKDIHEVVPSYTKLIKSLVKVSPNFAILLENSLEELTFTLVNDVLPILPGEVTSLESTTPDLQVAIRRGNLVIISIPALRAIEHPQYLILHEIMHGLVKKYEDLSPMKHTVVRSLVNYIKQNLRYLKDKNLVETLSKHGVDLYESNSMELQMIEVLGQDRLLKEKECELFSLYTQMNVTGIQYGLRKIVTNYFTGTESCNVYQPLRENLFLSSVNDDLLEIMGPQMGMRTVFVYEVSTENSGIFSGISDIIRDQCKEHASSELQEEIEKLLKKHEPLPNQLKDLLQNYPQEDFLDEIAFNIIKSKGFGIYGDRTQYNVVQSTIEGNKRSLEKVKENRKRCRSRFPFTSFK